MEFNVNCAQQPHAAELSLEQRVTFAKVEEFMQGGNLMEEVGHLEVGLELLGHAHFLFTLCFLIVDEK